MTTTLVIATLALMLGAYAICGIPFGYLISKRSAGVDVRTAGSGNIGSTNVVRTVGAKAGIATLVLDVAKGFLCVYLSKVVLALAIAGGNAWAVEPGGVFGWAPACVFFAAVAGHIFSPYLGFKGGKGIACGFGAALGLSWLLGLSLLVVFLIVAIPTRYVSLGSVVGAVSVPVFVAIYYHPIPWGVVVPVSLAAICAIWAHRQNVRRLSRGEEAKFAMKHNSSDAQSPQRETLQDYEEQNERESLAEVTQPLRAGAYDFGDESSLHREVEGTKDEVAMLASDVDAFEQSLQQKPTNEGEDA